MTASALRSILVPDIPEGPMRAFDRDPRTRVCAPSGGASIQALSRRRRKLPDKFFAMRAERCKSMTRIKRMRHRLHGTELPPSKPGTIPSPSEFRKVVSRASHSVELHDDGCDEPLPVHITNRMTTARECRLDYSAARAGLSLGQLGREVRNDLPDQRTRPFG